MDDLVNLSKLQVCEDSVFSYYRMKLQNLNRKTTENQKVELTIKANLDLNYVPDTEEYLLREDLLNPNNTEIITMVSKGKDADGNVIQVPVAIPLLNEFQPWLEIVEPVVYIDKNQNFVKNYKNIQAGDRLYVWGILDSNGIPWHLAATVVLQNGVHISFGMGYIGELTKSELPSQRSWYETITQMYIPRAHIEPQRAGLYTPDYLFINQVLRQLTKPKGKFLKLIAATDLTQEFVNYLNEEFDKINSDDISSSRMDFFQFKVGSQAFSSSYSRANITKLLHSVENEIRKHEREFSRNSSDELKSRIFLLKEYVNVIKSGDIPVGYFYNLVSIRDRTYCKISGKGPERGANCTSYLQKLFKGLLNCSLYDIMFLGQSDLFVVDPRLCRQAKDVAVPTCFERKYLTAERAAPVTGRPSAMVISDKQRVKRAADEDDAERLSTKIEKLSFKISDEDVDKYWANLSKKEKIKMIMKNKKHM